MDIVERLMLPIIPEYARLASDAKIEIERLREALREMVNEKCEYMHINHLGNPETTHTIKLARKALVEKK